MKSRPPRAKSWEYAVAVLVGVLVSLLCGTTLDPIRWATPLRTRESLNEEVRTGGPTLEWHHHQIEMSDGYIRILWVDIVRPLPPLPAEMPADLLSRSKEEILAWRNNCSAMMMGRDAVQIELTSIYSLQRASVRGTPSIQWGSPCPGCWHVSISLWYVRAAIAIALAVLAWPLAAQEFRRRAGRCTHCGYNRDGLVANGVCPECGRAPA